MTKPTTLVDVPRWLNLSALLDVEVAERYAALAVELGPVVELLETLAPRVYEEDCRLDLAVGYLPEAVYGEVRRVIAGQVAALIRRAAVAVCTVFEGDPGEFAPWRAEIRDDLGLAPSAWDRIDGDATDAAL